MIIETHRDPGVFERLGRCDPFGRIDGQHLINEIFGFRSHRVPLRRGKLGDEERRQDEEETRRQGEEKETMRGIRERYCE